MTSPTSEFSYSPPQTYDALYQDIFISYLPAQLKTDIKTKLSTAQQERIDCKQAECAQAVTAFINEKIAELAGFSINLLQTEVSNQQSPTESQDDLANNPAGNIASEPSSSSTFDVPRDLPLPSISSSSSSIASSDSPVPLKSNLVKTNNKKTLLGKSRRGSQDCSRKKKVMFSDKDEITIVPSIQELARKHDEQDDYREFDTSVASNSDSNPTSEILTTTTQAVAYEGEYYDDEDDFYNAGPSPQVFSSPLYSDSSYSSGLESMEGSPIESAPVTSHVPTTVVETSTVMTDPVSPVISSLATLDMKNTAGTGSLHVADSTARLDQAPGRKDSLETITIGTSPKSPPQVSTVTKEPSFETASPNTDAVPSFNRESSSSEEDEPKDNVHAIDEDDFDDDDDMFQFDETLGVDPGPKKGNALDEIKDLSSPYMNLSRFNVPSYQASLPADYEFPSIAASLPSNQSRTSLSHLPTVVGSLRPKTFAKYKPGSGSREGSQTGSSNLDSGNVSTSSSLSSSNATITGKSSFGDFHKRDFSTGSRQINGGGGSSSGSRGITSHLSSMNGGASNKFDPAGPSHIASSLPIQISRGQNTWGQVRNRNFFPGTIAERDEDEEGQHPVGSMTKASSFLPRSRRSDGKMLSTDGAEKELIALGSLVNNGSSDSDIRGNPPLNDEDILMLASPGSAAQLMNPSGMDPETMSFSQRLNWERRSSRGQM
ncbi:hypothetical protein D0Z00_001177 [Geotrichum galactomycetum]|uniref:Uncharacterized protein n=1 Tax=Geotrichum galactomycetum TaxID=27317 RepID=A0ACB6V7U7_9ASCO|nr:hypothetical protein D0Z00_001177 [Geotrichum candidum]